MNRLILLLTLLLAPCAALAQPKTAETPSDVVVYSQEGGDKWTIKMSGPLSGQITEDDLDITTMVSPCRGVPADPKCIDLSWIFFAVPDNIAVGDEWSVKGVVFWVVDMSEDGVYDIVSRNPNSRRRICHFKYKAGVGLTYIKFQFMGKSNNVEMDEPFILRSKIGLIP